MSLLPIFRTVYVVVKTLRAIFRFTPGILSKLCFGWICKALSFNFPNLWKLAAWEWIEIIIRENCAHGYAQLPPCFRRVPVIYSEQRTMHSREYAKAVLPSGALEWAMHRLWSALRDNVMDRPACFFISSWAVKEENNSTCQPWVHAESRSIWISRNRMLQRWKNRYGSTYQTGIRLKRSNLIRTVIKAKWHYE